MLGVENRNKQQYIMPEEIMNNQAFGVEYPIYRIYTAGMVTQVCAWTIHPKIKEVTYLNPMGELSGCNEAILKHWT